MSLTVAIPARTSLTTLAISPSRNANLAHHCERRTKVQALCLWFIKPALFI
jgi:hypothetical protein